MIKQHGPGSARADPLEGAVWRKATASDANSGCVEVAALADGSVGIRDSKTPSQPAIAITAQAWARFLADAQAGHLDP